MVAAIWAPTQNLSIDIGFARVRACGRSGVATRIRLDAAVLVVGQRDVDSAWSGFDATHSGRSMVVAPSFEAAIRELTAISASLMPVESGVMAIHVPVRSSENFAT